MKTTRIEFIVRDNPTSLCREYLQVDTFGRMVLVAKMEKSALDAMQISMNYEERNEFAKKNNLPFTVHAWGAYGQVPFSLERERLDAATKNKGKTFSGVDDEGTIILPPGYKRH